MKNLKPKDDEGAALETAKRAGRPLGSKTTIRWSDAATFDEVMASYKNLIDNGWIRPPIRTLLYQLIGDHPGKWEKKHYGTLCSYLERQRQAGELRYGKFADDSGGADSIPKTKSEIQVQIEAWQDTKPLELSPDGNLWLIFHEHEGMIPTLAKLFEDRLGIFSSQGEIRHEHLYSVISGVKDALKELNGKRIKILGIADYDEYGAKGLDKGQGHIIRNHKTWLENTFSSVDFIVYGITKEQIANVGLDPEEEHQFDGWLQRYRLSNFKLDIQKIVGQIEGARA
jgi:hypothetical protein